MAKKLTVTLGETRAAQAFLKLLRFGTSDPTIIAAIVSWYKVAAGSSPYLHGENNVFGLHPGAWDAAYRSGVREQRIFVRWDENRQAMYKTEYWSEYSSMTTALQAMAKYLLAHKSEYARIFTALSLYDVNKFFYALEASGLDPVSYMSTDGKHHRLFDELAKYGNVILSPAKPAPKATATKATTQPDEPPKPPRMPDTLRAPVKYDFLDPYEARAFYLARRPKVGPLGGII